MSAFNESHVEDAALAWLQDTGWAVADPDLAPSGSAPERIDFGENVRARLRVLVKRILRKYGYPLDRREKATNTVLEQAALLATG